jgi:hypothetical protein
VKNYLALWGEELPERDSIRLRKPVTVVGEREEHVGPLSEFAKIQLTVHAASGFEVEDIVTESEALGRLGVGWPDPVIFGLLDVLMLAEPGPLYKVRVVLEQVWYHVVDSSQSAFRHAGQGAGRKIIAEIDRRNRTDPGYDAT